MGEEVVQRLAREVGVRDLAGSLGCVLGSDVLLSLLLLLSLRRNAAKGEGEAMDLYPPLGWSQYLKLLFATQTGISTGQMSHLT